MEYGGALGTASSLAPESALHYDVAVVEPDPQARMRLSAQLAGSWELDTTEALAEMLRRGQPVVAVFGPGLAVPHGFQQIGRLTAAHPELAAVFAVEELSTPVLQSALRAGARDTVASGDPVGLAHAVARVGGLLVGTATFRPPPAAPIRAATGRLIAVFSAKGGVGKTTVAVNVATAMAQRTDERVALVDGDSEFGDVAVVLCLPPQHTVLDAAAAVQYGDTELVYSLLTRHDSGLLVLPAPTEPGLGSQLTANDMLSVCDALRTACGIVVVDLPPTLSESVVAILEAADEVLLVGAMDIPSVKNLKIGLQALDLTAMAGSKLRLVLNRANAKVKLDVREVEQVLGLRAEFPIPSDIAVPISVNLGVPVVLRAPRSPAGRALTHVATVLLGEQGQGAKAKGRRGRQRRVKER